MEFIYSAIFVTVFFGTMIVLSNVKAKQQKPVKRIIKKTD